MTLRLRDATRAEEIAGVTSFVGEDASGSFGILPGHARMVAALVAGLARFRTGKGDWRYLALPGAVLYFEDNVLTLSARRYLLDDDYERIAGSLREQLLAEEHQLGEIKIGLRRMEEALFKRLWKIGAAAGEGT